MKSPTAGMKHSSVPANTPGIDSGRITLRNAWPKLEYRSCAASTSRLSIFSRLT